MKLDIDMWKELRSRPMHADEPFMQDPKLGIELGNRIIYISRRSGGRATIECTEKEHLPDGKMDWHFRGMCTVDKAEFDALWELGVKESGS